MDLVEVKKEDLKWSQFHLKDGTVLRVRPNIVDVRRVRGQFTPEGDPLYIVKTGLAISTVAPEKLKKKWSK